MAFHYLGLRERFAIIVAQFFPEFGDEFQHLRVGPIVADLDVEEGLEPTCEDACGLTVGVDAEHLHDELLVVFAYYEFFGFIHLILDIKLEQFELPLGHCDFAICIFIV